MCYLLSASACRASLFGYILGTIHVQARFAVFYVCFCYVNKVLTTAKMNWSYWTKVMTWRMKKRVRAWSSVDLQESRAALLDELLLKQGVLLRLGLGWRGG